ncbi:MAG: FecR domain-containing protein [Calditrichaceae bacterium]|nr:FecR domain-containing protein [Calditrichaceae bacterium]MBN2708783.1 FecR domain-containing protein [Calditrichaceae bacterium]RQV97687.1 MAG: hypothetical protein EH224_01320 [Calditrichota bacterium]
MVLRMIIIFIILPLVFSYAGDEKGKQIGKISFSLGSNFVQSAGGVDWEKAKFKTPVYDKDKIKTAKKTKCEVTFDTKKVMRIGENSIVEIRQNNEGEDEVDMKSGLAWLSIFMPKGQTKLNMKTPSSVCAIRGTVYRLECDENHTTYRCYKGSIAVTPFEKDGTTLSDSSFNINAGEELVLVMNFEEYKKQQEKLIKDFMQKEMDDFEKFKENDQKQYDDMVKKDMDDFQKMNDINYKQQKFDPVKDMEDDWVKWNMERDRMISGE